MRNWWLCGVTPRRKIAHDLFVPREKIETWQILGPFPAHRGELRPIDSAVICRDTEEHQPQRILARVGEFVFHESLCLYPIDTELFPKLTPQRISRGLAGFHLTPGEFPFPGVRLILSTTANQNSPSALDERRDHDRHVFPASAFASRLLQQYQLAMLA